MSTVTWIEECASWSRIKSGAKTEPVLKAALAHLWLSRFTPSTMATAGLRGDRGHVAGAIGRELAEVLQHVHRDPRPAPRVLPHRRTDAARNHGRDALDGVIPGLSRDPRRTNGTLRCDRQARYWETLRDMPLNDHQRLVINRLLDSFEGKADDVEVGGAHEELKRHDAARHPATRSRVGCCCATKRAGGARPTR